MKKILTLLITSLSVMLGAQNCPPASASADLEINNIRARLLNGGDMWWDGVSAQRYEYPKIDPSTGAVAENILFAGGLWLSGIDQNNDLKLAAQTYRVQGHEFWPGPILSDTTAISPTTCVKFNRFFPLYHYELDQFFQLISSSNPPLSVSSIPQNILQWPAKGNQYLKDNYDMDIKEDLAPFKDCNNNGTYEPELGDYPLIKGDQCLFWVINDIGNTHTRSGGSPLGVEIQCMAYAYKSSRDAINDATFYDYRIIKKTPGNLSDFYFSQYVDPDVIVGYKNFIGCDSTNNYGFAYYNDVDAGESRLVGVVTQFMKTPNNVGMTSFGDFSLQQGQISSQPVDAIAFRNRQKGLWADASPMTCGANGIGGTITTKYIYPGNPADTAGGSACDNWSECALGNIATDRMYVMNSGPYSLTAGNPLDFSLAVMALNKTPYQTQNCPDKNQIFNPVVDVVNNFIDSLATNLVHNCKDWSGIVDFKDEEGLVVVYPNPSSSIVYLEAHSSFTISKIEVFDSKGAQVNVSVTNKNELNLQNQQKGIYLVKLYDEKQNKLLIKKLLFQ